jgi:Tat protein translocase TatB subunit
MFGIGASELILIVIIALIVVGPKNLPITLRAIGRGIAEFRRASRELRKEVGFDEVVDEVTRPLREGMAGVEAEVRNIKTDVADAGKLPPPGPNGGAAAKSAMAAKFAAANAAAAEGSNEYPDGGADDYGALPETAPAYPEKAPVYAAAEAEALEGTVPRSADPESGQG